MAAERTVEYGLCHCGCGRKTNLSTRADSRIGYAAGEPYRFLRGHIQRLRPKKPVNSDGYVTAGNDLAHRKIVSDVLGKPLRASAPVHHVNYIRHDNRNSNLVACNDQAYHSLLHRRTDALRESGNPNFERCKYCKQYDSPERMYRAPDRNDFQHRTCRNRYAKQYLQRRRLAKAAR